MISPLSWKHSYGFLSLLEKKSQFITWIYKGLQDSGPWLPFPFTHHIPAMPFYSFWNTSLL